jgi:mRNA interferase MazF
MILKGELRSGDIVWTNFDPSVGHEYQDKRPAIVIQSDNQLQKTNVVTVAPLTSVMKNKLTDDLLIIANSTNGLKTDSIVKVYCLTSIDYSRFIKKIGVADNEILEQIKQYLKKHFDL